MDTPRTPHGETSTGHEPVRRDALAQAVQAALALPVEGISRDVLAEVITRAVAAFTHTIAVSEPVTAATPGSAHEALAVVAGIEQLRSSLEATDATWQVQVDKRIRAADAADGLSESEQGRSASGELALARRISPHSSSLSLASARRLVTQMPGTFEHLSAGRITGQTAQAITRPLDGASADTCTDVDDWIADNLERLDGLGTRRTTQLVRELCQQADSSNSRARAERAARARNITMHPIGDGMARVTATLRALDAAAVMKSLDLAAESSRAAGKRVSHQALMADHLVAGVLQGRVAQQVSSPAGCNDPSALSDPLAPPSPVAPQFNPASPSSNRTPRLRLDVGIVITDRALLGDGCDAEMARIEGYGPVPAHILRDTVNGSPPGTLSPRDHSTGDSNDIGDGHASPDHSASARPSAADDWGDLDDLENALPIDEHPDTEVEAVFRRLYTHPRTGELVAMESVARSFPVGLKRMIRWRDQTCRTPWCNARIRHLDHITPVASGGPTSYENGQGLCARCNYLKEYGPWKLTPGTAHARQSISWHSPHGARGTSPTPHSELPSPHRHGHGSASCGPEPPGGAAESPPASAPTDG